MRRQSLSFLAVLSLLSLSTPALALTQQPAIQPVLVQEPSTVGPTTVTPHAFQALAPIAPKQVLATDTTGTSTTPSVPATASDLPPVSPSATLEQLVPLMVHLAVSGQWLALVVALVLGAVLVLLTVAGVRTFIGHWIPALQSDKAGVILSALVGPLGSLLASLASGVPLSVSLVLGIISSALASGVWSWGKKASAPPAPLIAR